MCILEHCLNHLLYEHKSSRQNLHEHGHRFKLPFCNTELHKHTFIDRVLFKYLNFNMPVRFWIFCCAKYINLDQVQVEGHISVCWNMLSDLQMKWSIYIWLGWLVVPFGKIIMSDNSVRNSGVRIIAVTTEVVSSSVYVFFDWGVHEPVTHLFMNLFTHHHDHVTHHSVIL